MLNAAGAVILLVSMRGIIMDSRVGHRCINFYRANESKRLSSNQKIRKTVRLLKVKLPSITPLKAGVTLFVLTSVEAEI
jgi:hypothetical protein